MSFGCVFISEPDIGASAEGPSFEGEDDTRDSLGEPSVPSLGQGGESAGGETTDGVADDASEANAADDFDGGVAPTRDAELDMSETFAEDADVASDDLGISSDQGMAPISDMDEAPLDPSDCGTEGCTANGYCDDETRPDCWLGDNPACYEFSAESRNGVEAYARCCGELGSCGPSGQWCEPAEPRYCALSGNPICYINGDDPISLRLCDTP